MKTGGIVGIEFVVTKDELVHSRIDNMIEHRKIQASAKLGQDLNKIMDIWEEDKTPSPNGKKFKAELAIMTKDNYAQMIEDVKANLEDIGLNHEQMEIIVRSIIKPLNNKE